MRGFRQDNTTPDAILKRVSGYPFYNTSRYTLGNYSQNLRTCTVT